MISCAGININSEVVAKFSSKMPESMDFSIFLWNPISDLQLTEISQNLSSNTVSIDEEVKIQDGSSHNKIKDPNQADIKDKIETEKMPTIIQAFLNNQEQLSPLILENGENSETKIKNPENSKNKPTAYKIEPKSKISTKSIQKKVEIKYSGHIQGPIEPEKDPSDDSPERILQKNKSEIDIKPELKAKIWTDQKRILISSLDNREIKDLLYDPDNKYRIVKNKQSNSIISNLKIIIKMVHDGNPTLLAKRSSMDKETNVQGILANNIKIETVSKHPHLNNNPIKTEHLDKTNLIKQLAERIHLHVDTGSKEEVIVKLKPDFLGQLKVRLVSENGHIKIDLITENHIVRNAISSHIPLLHQTLIEKGLPVQEINLFISWQTYSDNRRSPEHKAKTSFLSSKDVESHVEPLSSNKKVREIENSGSLDYWA